MKYMQSSISSLHERISILESSLGPTVRDHTAWVAKENNDLIEQLRKDLTCLKNSYVPAAKLANYSTLVQVAQQHAGKIASLEKKLSNTQPPQPLTPTPTPLPPPSTPTYADVVKIVRRQEQLRDHHPSLKTNPSYGSVVFNLKPSTNENLPPLISNICPELKNFSVKRYGNSNIVEITPSEEQKTYFTKNKCHNLSTIQRNHNNLKFNLWRSAEERNLKRKLHQFGFAAKSLVGSKINYYQIRGDRIRLIGNNGQISRFYYVHDQDAVMAATSIVDPDFDHAFPPIN